jgi:tripartite-type tricarboxylate transporter receptor subunit TctC
VLMPQSCRDGSVDRTARLDWDGADTARGMPMRKAIIAVACACFVAATGANADEFPSKNVTLMMPYAAGGPGDTLTRILGLGMSKALGRQVLVENTAGAAGTIGSLKVAQSPPDGYMLLVMHFGHAANTALYRNLRYDAVNDFEPIGMIAESPMAFVGKKDLAATSFQDLIAYVKTNQAKVTQGHAGVGSASHLCGLLFQSAIGTQPTMVAYRGTGPALNDLIGGQFDYMCDQTLNVLQPIKGGLIKGFAATTGQRLAVLPELPTAAEAGLPGFGITVWFGLWAPKGTPKPVVDKLVSALQQALLDSEVKSRLASAGAETIAAGRATPEGLRAHLKSEIDKWVPLIRKAGVTAD